MKKNKTERIEFLSSPELKERIRRAAESEGMGVSVWIRKTVLKELNQPSAAAEQKQEE